MTIEVTQNVELVNVEVTQNNNKVTLQPIVNRSEAFDGTIDGGTP